MIEGLIVCAVMWPLIYATGWMAGWKARGEQWSRE